MDYFLGMPIEVNLYRFIIGQLFGLAVLAFDFWSFQTPNQLSYFRRTTISSLLWVTMYLLIGAQLPIIIVTAVSTLRNIVFTTAFTLDTPRARMIARRTMYTSLVIALTASLAVIPNMRPETIPFQILLAITVTLFVIGQYMPGIWLIRIFGVAYSIAVLLLNTPLDTFNPAGIIIEVNKILAIAVFFVVYFRKKKESNRLAAIPPAALSLATQAPARAAALV